MTSRLYKQYISTVLPELKKRLKASNVHSVPRLEKVVLNIGIGKLVREGDVLEKVRSNLAKISGQRPVVRNAKKSISGFKLRQGTPVGLMVTLRGDRMYYFVDKLINIVFPRIRDFRGIDPKSVDARGSLSIGIQDHVIFPEIGTEDMEPPHGLQITLHTTAQNREAGKELFTLLGIPFGESSAS
ncbi:MAG: 50S ribosomal protein L5 [Parcubacteria group bacterium]